MRATLAFSALNFKRAVKDWTNFVFSILLPVLLYVIFGAAQDFGAADFPNGNVTAFVMVSMALYAGVTAAISSASSSVLEHQSGWGRQLALTPMTQGQVVCAQALVMLARAALSVVAVFLVGAFTGAQMPLGVWCASVCITVAVCLPFGFYGLSWVLAVPNENTVAVASTSAVLLAFAGNLFMPLSQQWLEWARFTPMYGPAALARFPVAEGYQVIKDDPFVVQDPLWYGLVNVAVWSVVFVGVCAIFARRDKGRV